MEHWIESTTGGKTLYSHIASVPPGLVWMEQGLVNLMLRVAPYNGPALRK